VGTRDVAPLHHSETHRRRNAQVWHALSRDHTVLPATDAFIYGRNEPYNDLTYPIRHHVVNGQRTSVSQAGYYSETPGLCTKTQPGVTVPGTCPGSQSASMPV